MSFSPPHRDRAVAESFGVDPARYHRSRPRYPDELLDRLLVASPGPRFLDVGIGTGIVAASLIRRGAEVLGVEADSRMADFARARGLTVEVARFEDWDPTGRCFDAVVSGQTWHWVDPVEGASKAASVLRPGGTLTLFWNVAELPAELSEAFAAVYSRLLPDSPFAGGTMPGAAAYGALLDGALQGVAACSCFDDPERWRFDWAQRYSRAEWVEQIPTFGGHSLFEAATLTALRTEIGEAIDAAGGSFEVNYATLAVVTRRKAQPRARV